MPKEPYVKPEVTSEVLEPGALGCHGSPTGHRPWLEGVTNPSCGVCCQE